MMSLLPRQGVCLSCGHDHGMYGDPKLSLLEQSQAQEIARLRAELEVAAADKRDAERWREIYNGHYIICKVYSNGDVQNLGGGYIGKYAIDAALAQRQGEGS